MSPPYAYEPALDIYQPARAPAPLVLLWPPTRVLAPANINSNIECASARSLEPAPHAPHAGGPALAGFIITTGITGMSAQPAAAGPWEAALLQNSCGAVIFVCCTYIRGAG